MNAGTEWVIVVILSVCVILGACVAPVAPVAPAAPAAPSTESAPSTETAPSTPAAPSTAAAGAPLRQEGDFYELRTPFKDDEVYPGPLIRKCGANSEARIASAGTNRFNANFYVSGNQVGSAAQFRRHPFSPNTLVGGAAISTKRCLIGVIVDGRPGEPNYKITLLDAQNGTLFSPNGSNAYPKLHQTGGILYVEPRIWFSPDDTIVMIIAAAPELSLQSNLQAHFIDAVSDQTIKILSFRWPETSTEITPYAAKLVNSSGKSQIILSLEGQELFRTDVP